jgi:integrase
MKLTVAALAAIPTPAHGQKKITDGEGLYLLVSHRGLRAWRWKYYFKGREQSLSMGVYPRVGLQQAREAAKAARELLRRGINPSTVRKQDRAARQDAAEATFERVALEFLGQKDSLAPRTQSKHRWTLRLLQKLHATPIARLTPPQIVATLKAIEGPGTTRRESAHRARSLVSRVCRYAVQVGYTASNPAAELREALKPIKSTPRPAIIEPRTFGLLLRVIDMYEGSASVANALKLAPYVFVRPGELRAAEWSEIDFRAAEWRIGAHRTKMRRAHVVPLSKQALAILKMQHAISGSGKYVFPGPRTLRPISDMTLTVALHNISPAFSREDQSLHGFRASASTLLHELGYETALIELQLSHVRADKVAGVYDRSSRLEDRHKMMQAWSDYLDDLRAKADRRIRLGPATPW